MKRPLELLTGILDDPKEMASDRVRGRFGGHDVEVRFVDRGAGSTRDPYTEVWFLGAAVRDDLRLHVIPQTADDVAEIAAGRGTDVVVGEPAFDEGFFVEAGPEDVVVRLFDATIRDRMKTLRPVGVHTHGDGLLIEKPTWENERALGALVELGAWIVDAIPEAFEAADRAAQSRTGYRTTLTTEGLTERRREEAATVGARRRERESHRATTGCLMAGAMMLAITIFAILGVVFCGDGGGTTIESYP
jgi:hypothetical protein